MTNISFLKLKVVKEKSGRYEVEKIVRSPEDIRDIGIRVLELQEEAEEVFVIITLDTKLKITGVMEVSRGSLNSAIVHPREIFKRALMQNAFSIILLHNHPTGNPKPSIEDIETTKRLVEGGKLLGIEVTDHIIIGERNKYSSFKELGYI